MSVNPDPPAQVEAAAAPVEAQPATTEAAPAPAITLNTAGMPAEAAQALREAYGHLLTDAPPTEAVPAADPASFDKLTMSSDDVLEAAPEAQDEGDEDDEPAALADAAPVDSGEPKLSRAQRAEQKRKAEVDAAIAEALSARDEQAKAQQALAARQAEDARVMAEVQAIMGADVDEQALIDAVAEGEFEAADKLKTLRAGRKQAQAIFSAAEKITYAKLFEQVQTAKALPGVDPAVVDGFSTFTDLFKHISDGATQGAAAALAAKDREWQQKLDQQKAEYETRLGRAATRLPTTEVGGRAVGAAPQVTLADVRQMFARGDLAAFKRLSPDIMALYQAGQLK